MSARTAERPGYYGKLPSHGDFLQRGLPREFVQPWDAWLQEGIAASRAQLAEGWRARYFSAPIWRFALQPGVCGAQGWLGILMPSVDRVGRCFPFTVAVARDPGVGLFASAAKLQDWYLRIEQAALAALEDNFDLAQLDSMPAPAVAMPWENTSGAEGERLALQLKSLADLSGAMLALIELTQQRERTCFWWHQEGTHSSARLELSEGLAGAEMFVRLL